VIRERHGIVVELHRDENAPKLFLDVQVNDGSRSMTVDIFDAVADPVNARRRDCNRRAPRRDPRLTPRAVSLSSTLSLRAIVWRPRGIAPRRRHTWQDVVSTSAPACFTIAATSWRYTGVKGGKARAAALTPAQRREIAVKAASSRWKKRGV
jgi:hypothetical protein